MPDICEIKGELKRLNIKGITGKRKAELLAMLPEEHEFRQRPARAPRAPAKPRAPRKAAPAPEPAPRPRSPSPPPIKVAAARRVVARAVPSPAQTAERPAVGGAGAGAETTDIIRPRDAGNYYDGKFKLIEIYNYPVSKMITERNEAGKIISKLEYTKNLIKRIYTYKYSLSDEEKERNPSKIVEKELDRKAAQKLFGDKFNDMEKIQSKITNIITGQTGSLGKRSRFGTVRGNKVKIDSASLILMEDKVEKVSEKEYKEIFDESKKKFQERDMKLNKSKYPKLYQIY